MLKFRVQIDVEAIEDINKASDWYENQLDGLGENFKAKVKKQFNKLKNNPEKYQVRYANVRCVLVENFPFLVHFTIDLNSQIVKVRAVYHTSRNPEIWLT